VRGAFVVIEGIDGAGGTTHSKMLFDWMREKGLKVILTSEPTGGKIGSLIRDYLKTGGSHPAIDALLFAADRIEHTERIKNMLEEGFFVVSDRYVESSIAYQTAEGLDLDWVIEVNKFAIKPDVTIILDLPEDVALERLKGRSYKEKFERREFLKKVREIYLRRAKENGYFIIDSTKSLSEVQREIREIIVKKFGV